MQKREREGRKGEREGNAALTPSPDYAFSNRTSSTGRRRGGKGGGRGKKGRREGAGTNHLVNRSRSLMPIE